MSRGASNQHRILVQRGGDIRDDWFDAISKASNQFASQQWESVQPFLLGQSRLDPNAAIAFDKWLPAGAFRYAWDQLEAKYPKPSKTQAFLGKVASIPGLSLIPGFGAITGLIGLAGNALHF